MLRNMLFFARQLCQNCHIAKGADTSMGVVAIMLALLLPQAGGTAASSRDILKSLESCRQKISEAERLDCLERGTQALLDAVARDDVTLVDRTMALDAKKRRFGLPTSPENAYGKVEAKVPPVIELSSTIAAANGYNGGRWNLTLADGSVWQLTEPSRVTPRNGHPIRVKRGAMGNYFAYVAGTNTPVRAKRMR